MGIRFCPIQYQILPHLCIKFCPIQRMCHIKFCPFLIRPDRVLSRDSLLGHPEIQEDHRPGIRFDRQDQERETPGPPQGTGLEGTLTW